MRDLETELSDYWDDLIGQSQPVDVNAVIGGPHRPDAGGTLDGTEWVGGHPSDDSPILEAGNHPES